MARKKAFRSIGALARKVALKAALARGGRPELLIARHLLRRKGKAQ